MEKTVGLTSAEAKERLAQYGNNYIQRTKKISPLKLLISQFTSPLILLLIVAALISFFIGFIPGQSSDVADTILILIIVVLSGLAGFFQDYKAEKTIESLQKMATPLARVMRDGVETEVSSTEIVPGDIILLDEGSVVPADARLIESSELTVDESMLTGESQSVEKKIDDLIYMDSQIYSGNAKAIVIKTGIQTKIGSIAEKLQQIEELPTLLSKELGKLSKQIFWGTIILTVIMAFVGFSKYGLFQSLLTAVALAVAAIPEALPAVVTITLALGGKVMVKNNALIRKLSAIEEIGAVDVICTDKTGTLTMNDMTVTKLFFDGREYDAARLSQNDIAGMQEMMRCSFLCNNSKLVRDENGKNAYVGNQTEIAVKKFSSKLINNEQGIRRISEIPFSSKRKIMSVSHDFGNSVFKVFAKGAPEILLDDCDRIYSHGKIIKLDKRRKNEILEQNAKFASNALRVIGLAYKTTKTPEDYSEKKLIWLGLEAMIDPPREEVKDALAVSYRAGMRVIMLTGDNPLTAKAIADQIGLKTEGVVEGKEIDVLNDSQLEDSLDSGINVFARVSPFHKLRILNLLQKKNRVAMTGDGVNDALALKRADVGIAMGLRGTEVAKEASDLILLDDNFATIVGAVKEGRRVYNNIQKVLNYLLTSNLAEVLVVFLATLFLKLPTSILIATQLLWINLLTDGLPALALSVDPVRPRAMEESPRKKGVSIINKRLAWIIGAVGIKKTMILILTFFIVLKYSGFEYAQTTLFTGFVLYEFVRVATIRSQELLGWLSNKILFYSLFVSVILQLILIYSPLGSYFHVVPLRLFEWVVLLSGIVIGYFLAIWITRIIMRKITSD